MEFVMLVRIGFVAFALLCGVSVGKEFLSSKSDTRYLSVRYVDEGEKTKVLAEHALQLGNNGTINFTAGGETIPPDDESTLRVGTHITGNLTSIENDSYSVSITLTLGNQVECNDAATQIVRSERLELRTELEAGRETKIPCGGNRWIQLRVDN
jgi:Tfp pilus assembly protein PilW